MRSSWIAIALCVSVAWPFAQSAAAPGFEAASVKPSGPIDPMQARFFDRLADDNPRFLFTVAGHRFETRGKTAAQLIAAAYMVSVREIVGPSWISDARFDIEAVLPASEDPEKASEMLRTLLEERLALKAHRETRRMSGYIVSIGKGGPKLTETGPPVPRKDPTNYVHRIQPGFNGTQMDHADMAQLTHHLAQLLGAPIKDETGLKGHYLIVIQYRYSDWQEDSARPGILQDALSAYGLRLASGKIDAPVLVIDSMSKTPTEN